MFEYWIKTTKGHVAMWSSCMAHKGWSLKKLTKCSAWQMFTKSVENGNKNADIFFLCPWGKNWGVNHFSKLNSFRDMIFQKWSITDETWRLSVSYTFMNDLSVIDYFWKFITRMILGFISIYYTFGEHLSCWTFRELF